MAYFKYPCKDCPDRVVGCHSTCEKYQAAKVDHKKKEAVILEEKKVYDGLDDYVFARIEKLKRKKER